MQSTNTDEALVEDVGIETFQSFVSFQLDEELFAIPVMRVIEILEVPKITKIPKSPAFLRGVINLRGSVLPVIDSRIKFGMETTEFTVDTSILVVTVKLNDEEIKVGTIVDSVLEVFELDQEQIQPSPTLGSKYQSDFIDGMIKEKEQFMMLVNIDKVFSTEEVESLKEQNQ
ncbi:MAG: chemotaxis protein CheW [Ekhidna sp.]